MCGYGKSFSTISNIITIVVALVICQTPVIQSLNLGLIAGDLKKLSSPLVVKKVSRHSPVFITINSGLPKLGTPFLPKLPPKPPPLLLEPKKSSKKLPRSILSPIPKLPILPPVLPIFPPLLPILPKIPLIPLLTPALLLKKLKFPMRPLRVPILKKPLLKPLKTELKTLKAPLIKLDEKDDILKKLLDLKIKGSLTTAEYIKFKKLLLK